VALYRALLWIITPTFLEHSARLFCSWQLTCVLQSYVKEQSSALAGKTAAFPIRTIGDTIDKLLGIRSIACRLLYMLQKGLEFW
jgi:hypothetical protein